MNQEEFERYLTKYFLEHRLASSSTALDSLTDPNYLNLNLLSVLDRRTILSNTRSILEEVADTYRRRTAGSTRKTKVRDIDVRPVLKRRFCSMPPFCRDRDR